jgi:hypothetical protein
VDSLLEYQQGMLIDLLSIISEQSEVQLRLLAIDWGDHPESYRITVSVGAVTFEMDVYEPSWLMEGDSPEAECRWRELTDSIRLFIDVIRDAS